MLGGWNNHIAELVISILTDTVSSKVYMYNYNDDLALKYGVALRHDKKLSDSAR